MRSQVGLLKSKYGIKKQGLDKRLDWKSYATVVAGTGKAVEGFKEKSVELQKKILKLRILVTLAIWGKTKTGDKK